MIMSMVNIPGEGRSLLVIVIEKDNFERMQKADPISFESTRAGGFLPPPMFPLNMSVLIAYEEDQETLYELGRQAKNPEGVIELIKYLERGRVFVEGKDGKIGSLTKP